MLWDNHNDKWINQMDIGNVCISNNYKMKNVKIDRTAVRNKQNLNHSEILMPYSE